MKTIIIFVLVLASIASLIGWFYFSDWVGKKTDSVFLETFVALGIPLAFAVALISSLAV